MTETPQDPYQPHPHPQPTVSSYDTQQVPTVAYQRAVPPPAPTERKRSPKIQVKSVAPLFAEAIRAVHDGSSVSRLFR